jgi:putative ABC transport system permease protein
MLIINYILLKKKLELSPLKLLRRDLKKKQQKKVLPLSKKIRFITRFQIRIIIQNISNYIVIFFGILFANFLLLFGFGMPSLLNEYQQSIEKNLICDYQYILSLPSNILTSDSQLEKMISMFTFSNETQTSNKDAEKFTAYSLVTTYDQYDEEEITLYGIQENSQYIKLDTKDKVYISKAYQEKYLVNIGDTIVLKEKYEDDSYSFKVAGIYDYQGALCVVMDQDVLNETLDLDKSYFSGYFSNSKIEDIDDKYISTCIDLDTLTKVSRQLTQSMGEMMYLVQGIAIIIYMIVIYLLSKVIIEKNAQSISMSKILGYSDLEISRLYILSTSFVVLFSLFTTLPLVYLLYKMIYRPMMIEMMSGWIPLLFNKIIYLKILILGISTYVIIAYFEYQKIRKIPKEEALKNVE